MMPYPCGQLEALQLSDTQAFARQILSPVQTTAWRPQCSNDWQKKNYHEFVCLLCKIASKRESIEESNMLLVSGCL